MGKMIRNCIIIIYVAIAIFVTVCLLSYNQYKVTEFGSRTFIIIDKENDALQYKKGDLIIANKENYENAQEGDILYFYNNDGVKIAEIKQKMDYGDTGVNFKIDGNYEVVKEDIIGTSKNATVISKLGSVLGLLESKWGFLFLIVFPSLLAFLHEIAELIKEFKSRE